MQPLPNGVLLFVIIWAILLVALTGPIGLAAIILVLYAGRRR